LALAFDWHWRTLPVGSWHVGYRSTRFAGCRGQAVRGPARTRAARPQLVLRAGLLLLAAGLAGCEYEDDVDIGPSGVADQPARTAPARVPLATRDPELAATEARNTAELDRLLGAPPEKLLISGSGGIDGPTGSGGFTSFVRFADAGRYTITVACVGASDAQLFVRQDEGDRLQLSFDCAAAAQATVELYAGPVNVSVMRYNGGGSGPGSGAVAGLRIVPASPGS
jgi:hypothetical protein